MLGCMLAGVLEIGCSERVAGGGATEETNGSLAGTVYDGQGSPAVGAFVYIRQSDFLKDTSESAEEGHKPDVITDASGQYHKDSLAPGSYLVEIRDDYHHEGLAAGSISKGKTTLLSKCTLVDGGYLEGTIVPVPGAGPGYVQISGLDRVVRTDYQGHYVFRNLPPGPLIPHFVSPVIGFTYPDPGPSLIVANDTAKTGVVMYTEAAVADYSSWSFSRKVYLNSAAAGLKDTLTEFPLLMRLDAGNFDFTASDGKDIRFTTNAGRPLQYQIERWNTALKKAEVWVKVDTLFGNSSDHFITMYWGKSGVPDLSSGIRVFPGFGGVWHMDSPDYGPGLPMPAGGWNFPDASPSLAQGKGNAKPEVDSGGIGPSTSFSFQSIMVPGQPSLMAKTALSISAWLKSDPSYAYDGEIATFGDTYGLRLNYQGDVHFYLFTDSTWADTGSPPQGSWFRGLTAGQKLRDNAWHHVASVWDGSTLRLYVDGSEQANYPLTIKPAYLLGKNFWIGKHSDGAAGMDFGGHMDEIRMSGNALSAARIRADFISQQTGSKLIEFR